MRVCGTLLHPRRRGAAPERGVSRHPQELQNRRRDIHDGALSPGEPRRHRPLIGRDPGGALARGSATVPAATHGIAAVIGGDHHHPPFAPLLPLLHRRVDASHQAVGALHGRIERGAVTGRMRHVVGMLEIHPRQIGTGGLDVASRFAGHVPVDGEDVLLGPVVRKTDRVTFEPVERVIERHPTRRGVPLTDEHGTIVEPGGEDRGAPGRRHRLDDAEDVPVVVVRLLVVVVPHVVLVGPRAREETHVARRGDRGRLGLPPQFATHVGAGRHR